MEKQDKKAAELSSALKGKFEMVGYQPGEFRLKNGSKIDTRTISMARAEELVKDGFPYLKKIGKEDKQESNDSAKSKTTGK